MLWLNTQEAKKKSDRTVQNVKDRLLAFPRKPLRRLSKERSLFLGIKSCQNSETAPISCDCSPRVASTGFWEMRTILFMVPAFNWGTFRDFEWFHLTGYINSQNTQLWAEQNTTWISYGAFTLAEHRGLMCLLSRSRIIGPIFYDQTVTMEV